MELRIQHANRHNNSFFLDKAQRSYVAIPKIYERMCTYDTDPPIPAKVNMAITKVNRGIIKVNRGITKVYMGITKVNRSITKVNRGITKVNRGIS